MSKSSYSNETKEINPKNDIVSFYEDNKLAASGNVHYDACEICKNISLDPSINEMSRLLRVLITLQNVCPNKEITIGCIVSGRLGEILAYKSDTFATSGEAKSDNCECPSNCITVNRTFTFILPKNDLCSSMDVYVKAIANYTSISC